MKYPLNERVIVGYHTGKNVSPFYRESNYITWIDIEGVCENVPCDYPEEHYMFDGQIFYQPTEAIS